MFFHELLALCFPLSHQKKKGNGKIFFECRSNPYGSIDFYRYDKRDSVQDYQCLIFVIWGLVFTIYTLLSKVFS